MTHIVMVVPNDVSVDSRVQKTARSAQDAGYTVTVLGASARDAYWSTSLNGVLVARVPRVPVPPKQHLSKIAIGVRRRVKGKPKPVVFLGKWVARVLDALGRRIQARTPLPYRAFGDREMRERVARASALEADVAEWTARFYRPIVDLNPDIIYVHDAVLLLAGGMAKEELVARGKDVQLVVDVHEWWPGVAGTTHTRIKSRTDLEDEWVPQADRVLTVSETLAGWLQDRYSLPECPAWIENAALSDITPAEGRATIREECGLADDVPLIVYAGAIAYARGLDVAIDAIAAIQGAHLVVVAGKRTVHVTDLEDHARARGIADRFHVVPYVPPESISWYLASASVGIAPFRRSKSHDSALATKISEYLNAGLPLVVSDCESQAKYVRKHGIGEVFVSEDVEAAKNALQSVLRDRTAYVSRISRDLLLERTWDYQGEVFVETLVSVKGPAVPRIAPRSQGASTMLFAREVLDLQASWIEHGRLLSAGPRQYRKLFGNKRATQRDALVNLADLKAHLRVSEKS